MKIMVGGGASGSNGLCLQVVAGADDDDDACMSFYKEDNLSTSHPLARSHSRPSSTKPLADGSSINH